MGTTLSADSFGPEDICALAIESRGDRTDPMPTAPAVFKKSRREKLHCLLDISKASLIDKYICFCNPAIVL
jgi:hypothetical protein